MEEWKRLKESAQELAWHVHKMAASLVGEGQVRQAYFLPALACSGAALAGYALLTIHLRSKALFCLGLLKPSLEYPAVAQSNIFFYQPPSQPNQALCGLLSYC